MITYSEPICFTGQLGRILLATDKIPSHQFEEEGIQEMPEVWEKGVRFFKIMSPSGEPVEFCQIL